MRRLLAFWWVAFLASLAAVIVIPSFSGIVDLQINKAFSDLAAFRAALSNFEMRHHRYPTEAEGLEVLKPDFLKRVSRDPWGNSYVYRSKTSATCLVYSIGVDGIDQGGEGDDVTSHEKKYDYATYGVGFRLGASDIAVYLALFVLLASTLVGLVRGAANLWKAWRRHGAET